MSGTKATAAEAIGLADLLADQAGNTRSPVSDPALRGVGLLELLRELGTLNTLLERACQVHLRKQGFEVVPDCGFLVVPMGDDDNCDHLYEIHVVVRGDPRQGDERRVVPARVSDEEMALYGGLLDLLDQHPW